MTSSPKTDSTNGSNWWTDPPKLIPIIVSVVALFVSGLSWWESHRGRKINEEINRPILSLSSTEIESDIYSMMAEDYEDRVVLFFTAKVKNVGKSTAIIQKSEVKPVLFHEGRTCKVIKDLELITTSPKVEEPILVGTEEEYTGGINLSLPCEERKSWDFGVEINMEYIDAGSGRSYSQRFHKLIKLSPAEEKKKREQRQQ